jgi:thiamine-phosphate pyrophosphorylase
VTVVVSRPRPRALSPRLVALTERSLASGPETLARFEHVARAARPWSVLFQLRDRELCALERLAFGRELAALCTRSSQWFQVNDRLDLAVLLGAHGVHLGEASVAASDARRVLGPDAFISRACHDERAPLDPAVDAWVLSPVVAARKGKAALGLDAVRRLRVRCDAAPERPSAPRVWALGGVTASVARACLEHGAHGVVVMGAVLAGNELDALVSELGIAV